MTSPNLEFLAVKDFYFSPTAKLADLVLPSSDWAERCTYNEEIDGNMILTFDQAVEAPGSAGTTGASSWNGASASIPSTGGGKTRRTWPFGV